MKTFTLLLALVLCTSVEARPKRPVAQTQSLPDKPFDLAAPKGWERVDDPSQLPSKIHVIYIGKATGQFTPSLNLSSEETPLTVEEYCTMAKEYHLAQGQTKCSSIGTLKTKAGLAHMLQIDRTTAWGEVRFIQAAIVQNKTAYVITATCLQEDFSSQSPSFFRSIQSFSVKKT